MSAAEDLRALVTELPPIRSLHRPPRGECCAPPIPTARGATHDATSCILVREPIVAANDSPRAPLPPRCPSFDAVDRDDRPYVGANLLYDVLYYRSLRARQMAGFELHPADEDTLSELEAGLRPTEEQQAESPIAHRRNFVRFSTSDIEGVAVARTGEPVVAADGTVDLGGGGICVRTGLHLEAGEAVTVHVRGVGDDDHRTVVLPARVAWSRSGKIGLMFAGGPSWS